MSWNEHEVVQMLDELRSRGVVKDMGHGAFTRAPQDDSLVQVLSYFLSVFQVNSNSAGKYHI